ncbi:MAG: SUMF1/EgtB/PvdO family nonheme iron enzyme [Anaerolineales bacterium]|nr:SUMF1/EgtB/PvdO family nonheme iron enzyme [Anaerolineales bacterium]
MRGWIEKYKRLFYVALPIGLSIFLFIARLLLIREPDIISAQEFAAIPQTTRMAESTQEADNEYIIFHLSSLEVLKASEEDLDGIQIYVVYEDGQRLPWGYHFPLEDDVFRVATGEPIFLDRYGGSIKLDTLDENLDITILVVRSNVVNQQVMDAVNDLLGDVVSLGMNLPDMWDLVFSQASNLGSEPVLAYLANMEPVDIQVVSLRKEHNWSIGSPISMLSQEAAFQFTYTVASSKTPSIIIEPLIVTATPLYIVNTPTPLAVEANASLAVVSENRAINNIDGQDLVRVPAGEFTMGLTDEQIYFLNSVCNICTTNVFLTSKPVHQVWLDEYWVHKTEVTVAQYKLCVADGACLVPHKLSSITIRDYYNNPMDQDAPVINVDWHMANAYCHWSGGRLPSEAEWEKAARGTDGRLFPWGNELPATRVANVNFNYGDVTYVGKFPQGASYYGALDMAGNVYEWVNDWYHERYYEIAPYENPPGPDNFEGEYFLKVVRGGSFAWEGAIASSGFHDSFEINRYGDGVGFRCVFDSN